MATGTTAEQTIDVVTPAAGESVTEGTILEWQVKVGDAIKLDDTIVEISTDKVDVELPSPASGTVSEILVEEGETVTVGQVIARIAVNGATPRRRRSLTRRRRPRAPPRATARTGRRPSSDPRRPPPTAARRPPAPTPARRQPMQPAAARPAAATARAMVDVVTPAAGESVTEGTILEWRVKVGDAIKVDDTIVEISTDKVDLELPSPASGTVSEMLVQEGDTVTVGQVIARIAVGDGGAAGGSAPTAGRLRRVRADAATARPRRARASPAARDPEGTKVSPVAARAAAVEGVDLGGGRGQRPGGSDHEVRRAGGAARRDGARRRQRRGDQRQRRAGGEPSSQLLQGGAAALARYMEQSRSIPTATSFRTLTVTRPRRAPARAEGGRAQGLVHAPDRLRDRARGARTCR